MKYLIKEFGEGEHTVYFYKKGVEIVLAVKCGAFDCVASMEKKYSELLDCNLRCMNNSVNSIPKYITNNLKVN